MTVLLEKNRFMGNLSNYFCRTYGLNESNIQIFNEETEKNPDISSVSFSKDSVKPNVRNFNDLTKKVNDFAKSEKLESELLISEFGEKHLHVIFGDKKYLLSFYVGEQDHYNVSVMFVPSLVPSVGLSCNN